MAATTEHSARVYDDEHGYYVEIRSDRDGLGLAEFAYSDGDKDAKEIAFCASWEMAEKYAHAILAVLAAREAK